MGLNENKREGNVEKTNFRSQIEKDHFHSMSSRAKSPIPILRRAILPPRPESKIKRPDNNQVKTVLEETVTRFLEANEIPLRLAAVNDMYGSIQIVMATSTGKKFSEAELQRLYEIRGFAPTHTTTLADELGLESDEFVLTTDTGSDGVTRIALSIKYNAAGAIAVRANVSAKRNFLTITALCALVATVCLWLVYWSRWTP